MSCNYRVIKLTLLMTCNLALKSIPNHQNNSITTKKTSMIDSFYLLTKIAGDVFLYFLIMSTCHHSLFNKHLLSPFVPGNVLGTRDTLVNKAKKREKK